MAKKISKIDIVQGDVLADLRSSLEKTKAQGDLLKASLIAIDEAMKKLKADAKSLKVDIQKVDPSDTKQLNDLNNKQREANKLLLEQEKIRQAQLKTELQIERNKQAQIRTEKMLNNETQKTTSAYKEQSKLLNKLRNEYKDLAVQGKTNTKEAKDLLAQITKLDTKLKSVDASVGQYQRNVGNYGSAWDNLKSKWKSLLGVAGQLGLAIGFAEVFSKGKKTLVSFDEEAANISKTLGVTSEEAKKLSRELTNIDTRTSIEQLQQIAVVGGQIGITKDQIVGFTESIDKLNVALGDEFTGGAEEITSVVGGLRNVFSDIKSENVSDDLLKIGNALNVLGAEGSATSPVMADFAGRIGGVGIPLGLTTGQVLGLSATLQELNVNAERGGTAVSGILKKMAVDTEGFAKVAGMPVKEFEKLVNTDLMGAFMKVIEGTKQFKGNAVGLAKVLDGLKLDGAGASEVFLKLGSNIDLLKTRTDSANESLTKTDSITDEFNKKNETLQAKIDKLSNAFDKYVLGIDQSGFVTGAFGKSLDFLSRNLETILSVVGRLIRLWIEYKAVVKALELKQSFDDWRSQKKAIEETGDALQDGAGKASAFGSALKSIGFAIAIDLAIELAMAFYDIASGAAAAREEQARLEKTSQESQKFATERSQKRQKELEKDISALQRLRNENKITEEQFLKRKQYAINLTQKQIQEDIKAVASRQKTSLATIKDYEQQIRDLQEQIRLTPQLSGDYGKRIETLTDAIAQLKANVAGGNVKIAEYRKELEATTEAGKDAASEVKAYSINLEDNTSQTEKNTEKTKKNTKETKEKTKTLKDANDEIERMVNLMKETQDLTDEIALYEAEADVQSAIQSQLDSINESGQYSLDLINQRIDAEYELKKAIIERNYLEQVDAATNEQEVINAQMKRDFELGKLEKERVDLKKDVNKQLETAQEEHADKMYQLDQQETEAQKEQLKKRAENQQKYIDFTTKYLEKNIDKRIALLEKEIEASQKQQQILQELAANGNIQASQSLAEQEKIEVEALRRKEKLERKKAQLQSITAFLNAYTNARAEGKTLGESLTIALGDKAVLDAIIETLPTFLEGTEDTGRGGNLDADGGFLSVLHPNERVMTKEQNAALMGMTNDEVVKIVQNAKINQVEPKGWENLGVLSELNGLKEELQDIKKAIVNKPETNIELGEIVGATMSIVKSIKKGNSVTYNKYKVK
jgi:TP901 family phage tail tape measure protein